MQGVLAPSWKKRFYRALRGKNLAELPRRFEAGDVVVDLTSAIEDVAARLDVLHNLQERVERDPEVRGGEPVFRGTRVPIYSIARKLELGASTEELLEDHPQLNEADLEIAKLYGKLYARAGRPRMDWAERLERRRT
ncbi:hypothetical protein BH23GEM9_BH23GEM9_26800 [soil metagenome]